MRLIKRTALLLICAGLSACTTPKEGLERSATSFFEMQQAYAESLDSKLGGDRWHIVPAFKFGESEIGSHFVESTPAPIGDACKFQPDQIKTRDPGPFPPVSESGDIEFGAGADEAILQAIQFLKKAEAKIVVNQSIELSYTELDQHYVQEDPLLDMVASLPCFDAIRDRRNLNQLIVRGIIYGKMKISSERKLNSNAEIDVKKVGNFEAKYDREGGFELEDTEVRPRFLIVTKIQLDTIAYTPSELDDLLESFAGDEGARSDYVQGSLFSVGDNKTKDLLKLQSLIEAEEHRYETNMAPIIVYEEKINFVPASNDELASLGPEPRD